MRPDISLFFYSFVVSFSGAILWIFFLSGSGFPQMQQKETLLLISQLGSIIHGSVKLG